MLSGNRNELTSGVGGNTGGMKTTNQNDVVLIKKIITRRFGDDPHTQGYSVFFIYDSILRRTKMLVIDINKF